MTELTRETVPTPVGSAVLVHRSGVLVALDWEDRAERMEASLARRFGAVSLAAGQRSAAGRAVRAWFEGALGALDGLPVDPGGTDFQAAVWAALRTIPVGSTTSYRDLAAALGRPGADRAVGAANGANPISVVLPCHRVIGADGALRNYAGGLARKRWLLRHEGVALPAEQASLWS